MVCVTLSSWREYVNVPLAPANTEALVLIPTIVPSNGMGNRTVCHRAVEACPGPNTISALAATVVPVQNCMEARRPATSASISLIMDTNAVYQGSELSAG